MNPQQHQALLAIKASARETVTIAMLAERLGIRHNSAVELVKRLIANDLVVRRENPNDRREVLVGLTRHADRLLAKLTLAHRDELKKLAPLLRTLLSESARRRNKRPALQR